MHVAEIDVRSAHQRMSSGTDDCVYLDVRSVGEYDQGHPPGAWNIPILHAGAFGMRPNPEFQPVAQHVLPKDKLILVGCKSGQRSFMACRMLMDMGFEQVMNVAGGLGGSMDPMNGRLVAPGWMGCGLPLTKEPTAGRTWDELRAQAL